LLPHCSGVHSGRSNIAMEPHIGRVCGFASIPVSFYQL
jgi:hypothetical protein